MASADCGVRNEKRADQRSRFMGKNNPGVFGVPPVICINTMNP